MTALPLTTSPGRGADLLPHPRPVSSGPPAGRVNVTPPPGRHGLAHGAAHGDRRAASGPAFLPAQTRPARPGGDSDINARTVTPWLT